MLMIENVNAN